MNERYELYMGDCLEVMKGIPDGSADLVLTDPPYGIDFQSQRKKNKENWTPKILNDKMPFVEFIPELRRVVSDSGAVMIFTRWDVQHRFIDVMQFNGMKPKNILIWDKVVHGMGDLSRSYGGRYESVIFWSAKNFKFNGKRPTDLLRHQRVSPHRLIHPNEKPISLLQELICQTTRGGEVVLDCFMGSGSTGVACANTGRKFIGIELDRGYFEVAQNRVEGAYSRD